MPDHLHCLLWLADPAEFTRFLHGCQRISSDHIRDWYKQHVPNYFADFGPRERFWQPKSDTFDVYSEQKLLEKLTYMHENPVRAGRVSRAVDWKGSPSRWYIERRSVGMKIESIEAG